MIWYIFYILFSPDIPVQTLLNLEDLNMIKHVGETKITKLQKEERVLGSCREETSCSSYTGEHFATPKMQNNPALTPHLLFPPFHLQGK